MCPKKLQYKYVAVDKDNEVDEENFTMKRKYITPRCLWTSLFTFLLVTSYYIPSISLTFYQRWLLQKFKFPWITVLVHMVVKYFLALSIKVVTIKRQNAVNPAVSWTEYLKVVVPVGFFSGIDIAFSNWGLELITITLYTMTKSTTVIFILVFAIFFKLEKMTCGLCGIVSMITVGLILVTYKATEFNLLGFVLLLLASLASGLRWTCVQLLLQKAKMGMTNPIDMIFHMQPWMFLSVLPAAVWVEGSNLIAVCTNLELNEFLLLVAKLICGALIAFAMEFAEFVLVTYTSSLTLSIAGVFKDVFMVLIAVAYGDEMSALNVIGLIICMSGVILHVVHKIRTTSARLNRPLLEIEPDLNDLKESLIDSKQFDTISSESDEELSDSQVLFSILNARDR